MICTLYIIVLYLAIETDTNYNSYWTTYERYSILYGTRYTTFRPFPPWLTTYVQYTQGNYNINDALLQAIDLQKSQKKKKKRSQKYAIWPK